MCANATRNGDGELMEMLEGITVVDYTALTKETIDHDEYERRHEYRYEMQIDDRSRDHADGKLIRVHPPWASAQPPPLPFSRVALRCGRCGGSLKWSQTMAKGETFLIAFGPGGNLSSPAFYCPACRLRAQAWALVGAFVAAFVLLVWWSL